MFFGEYYHNFDDKGRLTLPAKFREMLAGGVFATRSLDRCLWVFPRAVWEPLAKRIGELSITDPEAQAFIRHMFAGGADIIPDRQGRVLVPPKLREYASLDGEAVIVGLYNRLEIWNPADWAEVSTKVESDPGPIARKLTELGF
jgi:MraZ protein